MAKLNKKNGSNQIGQMLCEKVIFLPENKSVAHSTELFTCVLHNCCSKNIIKYPRKVSG